MSLLRKQVEFLAEENGKLVGHQNLNQKIQYLVKLKKDNAKLIEVKFGQVQLSLNKMLLFSFSLSDVSVNALWLILEVRIAASTLYQISKTKLVVLSDMSVMFADIKWLYS